MSRYRSEEDRLGGMVWGLGLVLLGTVILLQYLDVLSGSMWHHWWPLLVILAGAAQLVTARTPRRIGSGVSTMLIGGWLYVTVNHLWGLDWHTSWPLSLVAAGLGMVARSIAAAFIRPSNEHPSGCRCDECCGEAKVDA
jgi:hypothetical protein